MGKRLSCVLLTLCLGVGLALALLWLSAASPAWADANTHCVNISGSGCGGDCDGCYSSVQAAVDTASTGSEIRIAEGTYYGPGGGTVATIAGKELVIQGAYDFPCATHDPDMYETVLDGQWDGSVISITNAGDVMLLNLTLTRGDGNGSCATQGCGGGIHATETRLHVGGCVITNNVGSTTRSAAGGGIYVDNGNGNAPVEIWGSQIVRNTASTAGVGWGGGLYLQAGNLAEWAVVTGNVFEHNTASTGSDGQGGGMYLWQYATLSENVFRQNSAGEATSPGSGGALYMWEVNGATLEANRFLNNTASESGSYGYGGAIYGSARVAFTMTNNLLAGNDASAGDGLRLATWDPAYLVRGVLVNNTLADNDAGTGGEGIWAGSYVSLTLTNNIIAGHAVGVTNTTPSSSSISADTNVFWNTSDPIVGSNAIQQDPLLLPSYHLSEGSPALDAGLTIPWLTTDLEGNPRPEPGGSDYDIGAFEGVRCEVLLPLVLQNYP